MLPLRLLGAALAVLAAGLLQRWHEPPVAGWTGNGFQLLLAAVQAALLLGAVAPFLLQVQRATPDTGVLVAFRSRRARRLFLLAAVLVTAGVLVASWQLPPLRPPGQLDARLLLLGLAPFALGYWLLIARLLYRAVRLLPRWPRGVAAGLLGYGDFLVLGLVILLAQYAFEGGAFARVASIDNDLWFPGLETPGPHALLARGMAVLFVLGCWLAAGLFRLLDARAFQNALLFLGLPEALRQVFWEWRAASRQGWPDGAIPSGHSDSGTGEAI